MVRKQMWFGNEQRFQWVPQPASGMQSTSVGSIERIDYERGKVGVFRSMQTHREFQMDFPVQEAAGGEGLDVFNKFASGFYADAEQYPLFFADEMNFDQNLFPPQWAAPGLQQRGWSGICLAGPFEYYNLIDNPSLEVDATYWRDIDGTGGTASGARTASTTAASGRYVYRVSWTVGTSAASGGFSIDDQVVFPDTSYFFRIAVRSSKIQRVQMKITWRDAGNVSLGTETGTQTVLAANTWTVLDLTSADSPANSSTVDVEVTAVSGTSSANWANGDWLEGDAALMTFYYMVPPYYFDGDTARARWMGTVGSSNSELYVSRETPNFTDTAANSYELPPVQVTHNVVSRADAYPTPEDTFGHIPYAIIPIPPGYTLWYGYTGAVTGDAEMVAEFYNAPGDPSAPDATQVMTPLSSAGATRMNHSEDGYDYAKFYIRRTSYAASTITISSMMAQLWPTGVTPPTTGDFIEGKGHRGLKFADEAIVQSYVLYDPYRQQTFHAKGMSTTLVEAQSGD